jgi:hypothetical protein
VQAVQRALPLPREADAVDENDENVRLVQMPVSDLKQFESAAAGRDCRRDASSRDEEDRPRGGTTAHCQPM